MPVANKQKSIQKCYSFVLHAASLHNRLFHHEPPKNAILLEDKGLKNHFKPERSHKNFNNFQAQDFAIEVVSKTLRIGFALILPHKAFKL